ncbi:putative MarR family transcriptional regulator [Rhodococcus rhodnii LMG 5362]|uniref:Putative MarR family transcriptional regulator n=1 Tax=Rhodococcus rhodnii LMG 5362 TaxID=1273125 RepID=R7WHS2_9NOCA|nr:putative MarR family transcriptional regulator [Rhodococcus rhodnii LMG 5362]
MPTDHHLDRRTPWLTDDEMRAWRNYMDGSQRLMDRLNRDLQAKHDMTLADYRILVLLSESPDGASRMSDLADGILSSRSRLTHQIRRMEEQGMVTRDSCVEDGRGVRAVITDEGLRRLAEAAPMHVREVRANLVDIVTKHQLKVLGDVFERVNRTIESR